MTDIETYDDHDSWLARQRALLADLETMTDLPHNPPPRVLPPLPWWKDQTRVDGEAQRIMDAFAFAAQVALATVKEATVRTVRSRFGVAVLVALVLLALYAVGYTLGA